MRAGAGNAWKLVPGLGSDGVTAFEANEGGPSPMLL